MKATLNWKEFFMNENLLTDALKFRDWDQKNLSIPEQETLIKDLTRTRNDDPFFKKESTQRYMMLLATFYCQQNGVNYQQGMLEVVVPFLLLKNKDFPIQKCYAYFNSFMNMYFPKVLEWNLLAGHKELAHVLSAIQFCEILLKYHCADFYNRVLQIEEFNISMVATPLIMTLFTKGTPIQIVYLIFDEYMKRRNQNYIFFMISALFEVQKQEIQCKDEEELLPYLSKNLKQLHTQEDVFRLFGVADRQYAETPLSYEQLIAQTSFHDKSVLSVEDIKEMTNISSSYYSKCLFMEQQEMRSLIGLSHKKSSKHLKLSILDIRKTKKLKLKEYIPKQYLVKQPNSEHHTCLLTDSDESLSDAIKVAEDMLKKGINHISILKGGFSYVLFANQTSCYCIRNSRRIVQLCDIQNKQMLPESLPILKELSLEMDMLNGWMPNAQYPIRLRFELNDEMNINYEQLIYVGPRYVDSMELMQKYLPNYTPSKGQLDMMEAILKKQRQLRLFVRRPTTQYHNLQFDSDFESGNLDFVFLRQNEYYCYMRCDSNSRNSHSWYYFSILSDSTVTIKINICNFSKHHTLYQRGMKPYISVNGVWRQGGENVVFESKGKQNTLTFDLTLIRGQKVFVAYGVPYKYTQLLHFLQPFGWNVLTQTAAGVDVPMLTFGAQSRRTIIIAARVHPGESNSSYVMEGFLKYLTTPDAQYLLSNSQVIAIPMLNPDGVIAGNFRTCLQGLDLNRQFQSPDQQTTPQIYEIKRLVERIKNNTFCAPFLFLDFHGHSVKKNIFLYGPEYPIFSPNYLKCRILAKLMSEATEVFRYWSGVWRVQANKRTTARAILNQEYKIINCFTVECSNGLYYLGSQQVTKEFGVKEFHQMGQELAKQVQELLKMDIQYEKYQLERLKNRKKKRINPYLKLMNQIKKEEEEHQVQDEDELLESQSSEEEVRKKKPIIRKLQRQSLLRQEIECRKSFICDQKQRSQEKSVDRSQITYRPLSPYTPCKRSASSSRYAKQITKQRLSNYGFN